MQCPRLGQANPRGWFLKVTACLGIACLFVCPPAVATTVLTGTGTNSCTVLLNFSSGEKLSFTHRFDGTSILAQTALENVITETGGFLLRTGYLTDFQTALSLLGAIPNGLVVQYQSSTDYPDPYINGILWVPANISNGDYLGEFDWWQIWVQGPAELAQPYNDPPDPLNLAMGSGWISPPASGLKDIFLGNGASFGLVYGSSQAPSTTTPPPAPIVRSARTLPENQLEITFATIPNTSYVLKSRSQLHTGTWTNISSFVASSSNTVVALPMNHPSGHEFFRLEIMP